MTLIEKLEKLSDEYINLYESYGEKADLNCSGAVDEAINIVKEHECVLNGSYDCSEYSAHYTSSCENEYFDNYMNVDSFKCCPFCGGAIVFNGVE